jgi:hypothetical protein
VLEVYFSRTLGFSLLTLGALTVLLTGSVPLSSSLTEGLSYPTHIFPHSTPIPLTTPLILTPLPPGATTSTLDPKAPYALPTLTITAILHAVCAFYCYTLWTDTGVLSFSLGTLGSTFLAAVAFWCILFASSNGRISRKTGADKRTSGFPFKNAEASKRKGR